MLYSFEIHYFKTKGLILEYQNECPVFVEYKLSFKEVYMPYLEILISLVIGIIIGFSIAKITNTKDQTGKFKGKLLAKEAEIEQYKHDVNEHFTSTEELLMKLSDTYEEMQQHLASNAKHLLDNVAVKDIPFQTKEVIDPSEPIEGQPKDYSSTSSGLMNK
jgi:hypothetical protein